MDKEKIHGPLYFDLNTGAKIPSVGLGTWKAPPDVVAEAVKSSVKAGYRHIDCAKVYGNEKEIGKALKELFCTGVVERRELFITSKLWCSDQAPEDVSSALSKSLEDLQLDYIDLYLIHWPFRTKPGSSGWDPEVMEPLCLQETWAAMEGLYASGQARAIGVSNFSTKKLQDLVTHAKVPPAVNQIHWPFRTKPGSSGWDPEVMEPLCLQETWAAMEGLYASGQARAIGVSNFSTKKLQDLVTHAKVPPAVNQVECHIVWQQPALHYFCKSTGIHISAYAPLGSPGSWIKGDILKEPVLIEIAKKLNKSPAQVALRWGIQSGHSVLPKSVNESRIKENLSLFDWHIPPDLFSKFTPIHQQRLLRGDFAVHETNSPYKSLEELWDDDL